MWRLFRNFSNCDFNKHLTQHLRKLVQTLKIKRADPFNVCLRHQANPRSSLLLRYTIRLNIANIFFSFFFSVFVDPNRFVHKPCHSPILDRPQMAEITRLSGRSHERVSFSYQFCVFKSSAVLPKKEKKSSAVLYLGFRFD